MLLGRDKLELRSSERYPQIVTSSQPPSKTSSLSLERLRTSSRHGPTVWPIPNQYDPEERSPDQLADTSFTWYGPATKGSAAYFRVTGPTILIEYAPQGDPVTNQHIHGIYQSPERLGYCTTWHRSVMLLAVDGGGQCAVFRPWR